MTAEREKHRRALRRRRLRRRRRFRIAVCALALALAALALILILTRGDRTAAQPTPTTEITPTSEPTPEIMLTPTPEPTPEVTPTPAAEIPIRLYAPDGDGIRHRLSEYACKWTRGKDIDCFEALVSDAETLTGKNFLEIARETWGTLPDPYAMRIGYTLSYETEDGQSVELVIRSPKDISHTEYVECYLYDDVHTGGGFYTHLSEANMKDNTLITSIKLTCGEKIDQVREIRLGVFLYDSQDQFDEQGRYTGSWHSEIDIRRKA